MNSWKRKAGVEREVYALLSSSFYSDLGEIQK